MSNIPVTQKDDFIADFHEGEMDFTKLKEKSFIVAVSTGDRNKCKLLASTLRGPYDFFEMVEATGYMYEKETHHAKVTVLSTNYEEPVQFLDNGTIDYIEAHWKNIISEGVLETMLLDDCTMEPGLLSENELKKEEE